MSKLEQLQAAINSLPDEYQGIRAVCLRHLGLGDLMRLNHYTQGLWDMATHLTSEDALLVPLSEIREMLK